MDKERFLERKTELLNAISRLEEACAQPFSSFIRDAVIQRFEFCWELAWKTLKLRLEQLGVEALNPRDTYREALNKGLIHDGNAWSEAHKKRNLTTHTYDEALAQQVYDYLLQDGVTLFQQLKKEVTLWKTDD
jgi:nucleotidyltransferase substrate binding protein (TIGR01987 family)